MTHYPYTVEDAMKVTEQEAWVKRPDGIEVLIPPYIRELVSRSRSRRGSLPTSTNRAA